MTNRLSRRQLFRLAPWEIVRGVVGSKSAAVEKTDPIRPPGALEEEQFTNVCARCGSCSEACPHDVIQHLGPAAGAGEGTPFLVPGEAPCHWCASMDCIHACESGALRMTNGEMPGPIAKAVIDRDTCLVSEGILCDTCKQYCPTSIRAISMVNRKPIIDSDLCTGCGLCSYHCSASESAIRIVLPGSGDSVGML